MADQQLALSAARALRDHGYISSEEFASLEQRILSTPAQSGYGTAQAAGSNQSTSPAGRAPTASSLGAPPVAHGTVPPWNAPRPSTPTTAKHSTRSKRSKNLVALVVGIALIVGIAAFGFAQLSGRNRFTAQVAVAVLGADCDDPGYSDMDQIVVVNPAGDEVAYADLTVADEGGAYCHYVGDVTIGDDSKYFRIQSRRESRAALRFNREEAMDGMDLSIGDCDGYDVSSSDTLECLEFVIAMSANGGDAVEN